MDSTRCGIGSELVPPALCSDAVVAQLDGVCRANPTDRQRVDIISAGRDGAGARTRSGVDDELAQDSAARSRVGHEL